MTPSGLAEILRIEGRETENRLHVLPYFWNTSTLAYEVATTGGVGTGEEARVTNTVAVTGPVTDEDTVRQCRTGWLLRTVVSGLGSVTYSNPSPALAWGRGTRNREVPAGEKCFGPRTERTIVRAPSDHVCIEIIEEIPEA